MAEADAPVSPAAPAVPYVNPWIIAIAVMFATFMEVLDTTVVNVSLPHVAGSLSASIDESTWALTSYLVANAIILPLSGWLSRQFGRKRLLMLSVTGFTVASFFCGLAWSLPALIVFRVIQGTTGGALQPLSQAVMLEAFPPERRGKAMAFWGLGIVTAPILGPVLGGWLTDSYSWRWVFYINIPVGLVSLVMMQRYVFDPPYVGKRSTKVDWGGIGLLALGIGALQILLDKGQEDDWFESALHDGAGRRVGRLARPLPVARAAYDAAGRGPARLQEPHLRCGRPSDDERRLRPVRQPRAAADLPADAPRLPVACRRASRCRRAVSARSSRCRSWARSSAGWTRGGCSASGSGPAR